MERQKAIFALVRDTAASLKAEDVVKRDTIVVQGDANGIPVEAKDAIVDCMLLRTLRARAAGTEARPCP